MIASPLYAWEKNTEQERKNNKDRCRLGETVIQTDSKGQCSQLPFYLTYWKKNLIFESNNKSRLIIKKRWTNILVIQTIQSFTSSSRCSKWFGSFVKEKKKKIKKKEGQFIPRACKIQRQRCYRAPIKKLSLHRRWHPLQPLLTTPLFQSVSLSAHSLSICLPPDEASSHRAIQTRTEKKKILLQFFVKVLIQDAKCCIY